jgi:O-antigen ligase
VGKRLLKFGIVALVLLAAISPWLLAFVQKYNKLTLDASALGRLLMWARGLTVFADHPVIGIGMNTWGFVQERYGWMRLGAATYGIEGGLLFVAVMTGVVGLVVYLMMMGAAMKKARSIWRSPSIAAEYRALAVGSAAFTAALVVHSLFANSLFLPYLMEPLYVLWAVTRAGAEQPDTSAG